jgi:hypothetical protein
MSQVLVELSAARDVDEMLAAIAHVVPKAQNAIESLWAAQNVAPREQKPAPKAHGRRQMALFSDAAV